MKENFSSRLTALRESRNWTKSFVAERLGISPQRYSNYEYGRREPDIDTIRAISKLFNTTTDYLLGRTDISSNSGNSISADLDNTLYYNGKEIPDKYKKIIKELMDMDDD